MKPVLFTTAMDMLNHLLASQVDHSLVRSSRFTLNPLFRRWCSAFWIWPGHSGTGQPAAVACRAAELILGATMKRTVPLLSFVSGIRNAFRCLRRYLFVEVVGVYCIAATFNGLSS